MTIVNRRILVSIIAGGIALVLVGVAGVNFLRANSEFFRQFLSFTLTVDNQSDYDIISVETGIYPSDRSRGKSTDLYASVIESGQQRVIKPRLSISGEGGIYMKYRDSSGKEVTRTVCSYTESTSGFSIATIMNDEIEVEEKCS